jgi:hypothetical protein
MLNPSRPSLMRGESLDTILAVSVPRALALSRSGGGISDTSVSTKKPKLAFEGAELATQVSENFSRAIWLSMMFLEQEAPTPEAIDRFLVSALAAVNHAIASDRHVKFRSWHSQVPTHPAPSNLPYRYAQMTVEFSELFTSWRSQPEAVAALVEQKLNGEVHPFSDGCGRVSRALACAILARAGKSYPLFSSPDEYLQGINASRHEWIALYSCRITAPRETPDVAT